MKKVATKCYLPATNILLDLVQQYKGAFKFAFSISGVAIEQMQSYAPEALESLQALAASGNVEFLGETYYHSLTSLYDLDEFRAQVEMHRRKIVELFKQTPRIFRNTELIYRDDLAPVVSSLGFEGILAEGCDDILEWRSPYFVYETASVRPLPMLLRSYRLADDVAFRFSNRAWQGYPLGAEKFADWVRAVEGAGESVNLFMDFETFGEHQWKETGIFEFLEHFPRYVLSNPNWSFKTPTETIEAYKPIAPLSFRRTTSWADVSRDVTAWNGNQIQESALRQISELGSAVKWSEDRELILIWRNLQTSDHFYYMSTKASADGEVHSYFSPFDSPYEAFINYMNVLKSFREHLIMRSQRQAVAA